MEVGDEVGGEVGFYGVPVGSVFEGYGFEVGGGEAVEAGRELVFGGGGVAEVGFSDAGEAGDDFGSLDVGACHFMGVLWSLRGWLLGFEGKGFVKSLFIFFFSFRGFDKVHGFGSLRLAVIAANSLGHYYHDCVGSLFLICCRSIEPTITVLFIFLKNTGSMVSLQTKTKNCSIIFD